MTSLLARWLFAVTLLCIRIFLHCIAMRCNKTEIVIIGHLWKLFPLSFGNITLRLRCQAIFPPHFPTSTPVTICILLLVICVLYWFYSGRLSCR